MDQSTIRNANARTKVKQFRCLPLETNNQNWTLHKVGDTYSVAFGLVRGIKKRVPLVVHHAARRTQLQAAGKHRAVKKLDRHEGRMVTPINHAISKDVVALAQRCGAGIRLEDLSGIRQRAKQRHATKADAGQNRDYWPFFQLEQFITYKAQLAGILVEKVPAAYTTKTCHRCGQINPRIKHAYHCARCGRHAHADANAAMNIRDWLGWCCPLVLEAPVDGAHGTPPNTVRDCTAQAVSRQEREPLWVKAEEDVKAWSSVVLRRVPRQ